MAIFSYFELLQILPFLRRLSIKRSLDVFWRPSIDIPPWTVAPRTITPGQLPPGQLDPRQLLPRAIAPLTAPTKDNCPPDKSPGHLSLRTIVLPPG